MTNFKVLRLLKLLIALKLLIVLNLLKITKLAQNPAKVVFQAVGNRRPVDLKA